MDLFFDSSALVKRYVNEIGSTWVTNIVDISSGNHIYIAEITGVEITAAIARRTRRDSAVEVNAVFANLRHELNAEYLNLEIISALLQDAQNLARKHLLRGYDAVQLAVAIDFNREQLAVGLPAVTLVSADTELLDAARAEGLLVENSNQHP
ncbi:MAG: type II toxin-antitoxin system VapC family toxin [Pyrinomonadaceae bacterium]